MARMVEKTSEAIVRVDPIILETLQNMACDKGSSYIIYTNNSVCKFNNRFYHQMCYTCQAFGHKAGSSVCPYTGTDVNICRLCSEQHNTKQCPNRGIKEKYKCINCIRYGSNNVQEGHLINHSTTDHCCPIFTRQKIAVLQKTLGMEGKNLNDFDKNCFTT